jgi:pyrophosphate--fructose-6-phosphate 1-phosphotransferase
VFSLLQKLRLNYQPHKPHQLNHLKELVAFPGEPSSVHDQELKKLFPQLAQLPFLIFDTKKEQPHEPKKVGVVLSGGQAPGGHNVIVGLFDALKELNPKSSLIGFLNGPSGIIENKTKELTGGFLDTYRNTGGFDMIGSGRTKIETPEQFAAAEKVCREHNLDGLVIIGGDDSNTNAALLAEYFKSKNCKTAVVGVPKTIDGDLKNAHIEISFGFDTACKVYSEIIGNLERDALSAKKYWFFVKIMGRSASHVALECALQTHPNITLIGEEIEAEQKTLDQIVNEIADVIHKRAASGKHYGVIIIPEGIIEFIPEFKQLIKELNQLLSSGQNIDQLSERSAHVYRSLPELIQKQLLLDRDPHGNVQVSKIETERLLIEMVKAKVPKLNPQPLFCGYEGRSCLPSNFDCQYCYALGQVAAVLISSGATGYMARVSNLALPVSDWKCGGIPLVSMMHMEVRKGKSKPVIRKALVDLDAAAFRYFADHRESWALGDDYQYPGPIQYFGPSELTEAITLTLENESASRVASPSEDR